MQAHLELAAHNFPATLVGLLLQVCLRVLLDAKYAPAVGGLLPSKFSNHLVVNLTQVGRRCWCPRNVNVVIQKRETIVSSGSLTRDLILTCSCTFRATYRRNIGLGAFVCVCMQCLVYMMIATVTLQGFQSCNQFRIQNLAFLFQYACSRITLVKFVDQSNNI